MNRKVLYGYQIEDGKLIHQPQEAEIVRRIFTLYLEGKLQREISDLLNGEGILYSPDRPVWTKFRVAFILKNRRYMGADGFRPHSKRNGGSEPAGTALSCNCGTGCTASTAAAD